jgi:hypothetical protein
VTVSAPDRLELLLLDPHNKKLTGIDFVEVDTLDPDGRTLYIHFLRPPSEIGLLLNDITQSQVTIYRDDPNGSPTKIPPAQDPQAKSDDDDVLELVTEFTGDYSPYRLSIEHPSIDPYFNDIQFSFKAICPSDVDCRSREKECPPEETVDFPIDYKARDFWSLRRAMMEFAAQRYPEWQDRGREADVGVMFAEVLSALGDELAYYQDRVAREAYLETATQRRSLRRHARLVDYAVHDGLGAKTWLDVTVEDGKRAVLPAGLDVSASSGSGSLAAYEVGRDLREILIWRRLIQENGDSIDVWDTTDPYLSSHGLEAAYRVDWRRNSFQPYLWDEDDTCLSIGATELFIEDHQQDVLEPFDDCPEGKDPGRWVLLETEPINPALPARSWMVRVIQVENLEDSLLGDHKITRIEWEQDQALPFEMDLTVLQVRGNLVPVVAGSTQERQFRIRMIQETTNEVAPEVNNIVPAVERRGANNSVSYLYSLPGTEKDTLVWAGDNARSLRPEIVLCEEKWDEALQSGGWASEANFSDTSETDPNQWSWRRSLLGVQSSQPYDKHFTLDDGAWARVVGYQRGGEEIVHVDYKADQGFSIRFGDGEFGAMPARGQVFRVFYRIGGGRQGNIPADALTWFDPESDVFDSNGNLVKAGNLIRSVTNPLPAINGTDPELATKIKQLAPDAFRSIVYRAVTARDYAESAERLPWVQRAGAAFRWTGSWLSCFVTPDPHEAVVVSDNQKLELGRQLDSFRQAGREVHTLNSKYVDLDLEIHICVEPSSYHDQVKERVMRRLLGKAGRPSAAGFFSPDNFTFGTPLERSVLESFIQDVPGVRAVDGIKIARRGHFEEKDFNNLFYEIAMDEVIRVENDPNHPDRGSVLLEMKGGA